MISLDRTTTAALLTAFAVLSPCVAWYVTGSRDAQRRAADLERTALTAAQAESSRIATQISLRLESLRQSESRRPFSDYLGEAPLRVSNCDFEPKIASPLAQGPADPLIWAHFQIDDLGQLLLPTLGPETAGRTDSDFEAIQRAIFDELECASSQHLAALHPGEGEGESRQLRGFAAIGPFSWHAVSISGQPALVALREVTLPDAGLTQGFVILGATLNARLVPSAQPARIRPGPPERATETLVPLDGDDWTVTIDAEPALAAAVEDAAAIRLGFRRRFVLVSLLAAFAGALIVLLVRQTDRVARERARFAASAAHELRTPLAGLQLYGEMLVDGSGDATRARSYAQRIADEAERLGRVVSNVLGFSQLERGTVVAHPEPGDLAGAVESSLDRLRPALEAHGAQIAARLDSELPPALFDRDALHQILQNLLDNAEKYTRNHENRTIEVGLRASARGPVLEVVDHGPGVRPALVRRLFTPTGRPSDPSAPAGLGIGLTLVRALARAQEASVSHAAVPGGGASFSVCFRAAA